MRPFLAALCLLPALAAADPAGPVPSPSPSATPTAAVAPSPAATIAPAPKPEDFAASASALDAELGYLDGGSLTRALRESGAQGRPLRLLLDPSSPDTRREGARLAGVSPTVQVRWSAGAGSPQRRLLAGAAQLLRWSAGADAARDDAAAAEAALAFEARWASADLEAPRHLRLEDQLKALPDPSEQSPHIKRRREGGAKDESHEDAEDQ